MAAAEAMAARLEGIHLRYSQLDDAAALVMHGFGGGGAVPRRHPPLPLPESRLAALPADVLAPDQRLRRRDGVAVRLVGSRAFLWQPGETMLYALNPAAQAIWEMLAEPATAADLADVLHDAFAGAGKARILADALHLLGQWQAAGLVQNA